MISIKEFIKKYLIILHQKKLYSFNTFNKDRYYYGKIGSVKHDRSRNVSTNTGSD